MSKAQEIYVVDDDRSVLESMSFLLESFGHKVTTFSDASSVLEAAGQLRVGCLLIDVSLPDLDGLQLFTALRERGVELRSIMMSGHADEHTIDRALQLGVHAFYRKPIDLDALLHSISE